jgi:hypothetical protein
MHRQHCSLFSFRFAGVSPFDSVLLRRTFGIQLAVAHSPLPPPEWRRPSQHEFPCPSVWGQELAPSLPQPPTGDTDGIQPVAGSPTTPSGCRHAHARAGRWCRVCNRKAIGRSGPRAAAGGPYFPDCMVRLHRSSEDGCSSRQTLRRWWSATSKLPWTTNSRCLTSRTVSSYSTCPDWRALARSQQRSARGDRK